MMLSRRSFMQGSLFAALLPLISSCGSPEEAFTALLLAGALPPQSIQDFRSSLQAKEALNFSAEARLEDLMAALKVWKEGLGESEAELAWWNRLPLRQKKLPKPADLTTVGHYQLSEAIAKQYIQPLDPAALSHWPPLSERLKLLATRAGKVWGAPYRWGTTAIVYNRDRFEKLGWTPQDWSDLWRQDLRRRIAILDQPREAIGLTLKALGYSYNEYNPRAISSLKAHLANLHQQIKFYSSTAYLQPLVLKDVWLAVGWSSDIAPLVKRYPYLETVIPASGTALWADLWVKPATARNTAEIKALRDRWIDFCWQEKAAQQISLFTAAAPASLFGLPGDKLPQTLQGNKLILPDAKAIAASEFILPLPSQSLQQYDALWKEMRSR